MAQRKPLSVPLAQKSKTSRELLGEQVGESQDQIRRYIRLTNLIMRLLLYESVSRAVCQVRSCNGLSDDWSAKIDEDYKKRSKKNI